jgi:hypothetical protein
MDRLTPWNHIDDASWDARRRALEHPRAARLTTLVRELRQETGQHVPFVDPYCGAEDARVLVVLKRPSRERENLVGERTRIVNRMKAALIRLGIRGFKPWRWRASCSSPCGGW